MSLAATTMKQKIASLRVHFDQHCEFCDGARRLVEAVSTRVCEMSGRPGVDYLAVARELGVKHTLRKPFEITELLAALKDAE